MSTLHGSVEYMEGPAKRTLRLHNRSTGELIAETISNSETGVYSMEASTANTYYLVGLEDYTESASGQLNAAIVDFVSTSNPPYTDYRDKELWLHTDSYGSDTCAGGMRDHSGNGHAFGPVSACYSFEWIGSDNCTRGVECTGGCPFYRVFPDADLGKLESGTPTTIEFSFKVSELHESGIQPSGGHLTPLLSRYTSGVDAGNWYMYLRSYSAGQKHALVLDILDPITGEVVKTLSTQEVISVDIGVDVTVLLTTADELVIFLDREFSASTELLGYQASNNSLSINVGFSASGLEQLRGAVGSISIYNKAFTLAETLAEGKR